VNEVLSRGFLRLYSHEACALVEVFFPAWPPFSARSVLNLPFSAVRHDIFALARLIGDIGKESRSRLQIDSDTVNAVSTSWPARFQQSLVEVGWYWPTPICFGEILSTRQAGLQPYADGMALLL
jgi:hypothetical protein